METEASIGAMGTGGLSRQTSITKTNCICSPTTHPGSFRCKLHRTPSLHRTKSVETNILQNLMTKPDDSSTGDEAAKQSQLWVSICVYALEHYANDQTRQYSFYSLFVSKSCSYWFYYVVGFCHLKCVLNIYIYCLLISNKFIDKFDVKKKDIKNL